MTVLVRSTETAFLEERRHREESQRRRKMKLDASRRKGTNLDSLDDSSLGSMELSALVSYGGGRSWRRRDVMHVLRSGGVGSGRSRARAGRIEGESAKDFSFGSQ